MWKSAALMLLLAGLTSPRLYAFGQSHSVGTTVVANYDNRSFASPVRLPEKVIRALLHQKETSFALDWAKEHPGGDLNRFFRATATQLSRSGQSGWIVEGVFPLSGADCDWFWLVREGPSGPRVVLFYNGYTIDILSKETNGLRDIRATWESPNERSVSVYHYNGVQYKLVRKYWQPK